MYLMIGIAALLIGPLAYAVLGQRLMDRGTRLRRGLDMALTVLVTVLAIGILWDATHHVGDGPWIAVAVMVGLIGFVIPLAAERMLHQQDKGVHILTLIVGVAGLVLHAAADGAALLAGDLSSGTAGTAGAPGHDHGNHHHGAHEHVGHGHPEHGHGEHGHGSHHYGGLDGIALALAVIAHRLPAGLGVWWLVRNEFGPRIATLVLGLMVLATVVGYEAAAQVADLVSNRTFALFQAFVAGSLLHLAFHRQIQQRPGHKESHKD